MFRIILVLIVFAAALMKLGAVSVLAHMLTNALIVAVIVIIGLVAALVWGRRGDGR